MDVFAAGANRTYQKQRAESAQQPLFTLEDNALARVIEDQKKVRAEEAAEAARRRAEMELDRKQKEVQNAMEMARYLEAAKVMLNAIGRPVKSFYINPGGEVITVHKETESIRVPGMNLSCRELRWISLRKVIEAVIG